MDERCQTSLQYDHINLMKTLVTYFGTYETNHKNIRVMYVVC